MFSYDAALAEAAVPRIMALNLLTTDSALASATELYHTAEVKTRKYSVAVVMITPLYLTRSHEGQSLILNNH